MKKQVRDSLEQLSVKLFGTKNGWRKLQKYSSKEPQGGAFYVKQITRSTEEILSLMENILKNTQKTEINNAVNAENQESVMSATFLGSLGDTQILLKNQTILNT